MAWFTPARHVLLTGAGFTKNYGGYLASEMWAAILRQPEIRHDQSLRQAMLLFPNFEEAYDHVLRLPQYSGDSKRNFALAIHRAYSLMHDRIYERAGQSGRAICRHLLTRFAGAERTRGFFFTLNQDLFIEQFFPTDCARPITLGLDAWLSKQHPGDAKLDPNAITIQLPDDAAVDRLKATVNDKGMTPFPYVKLHGSLGWTGHDGNNALVIGQTKSKSIRREPLLRWYLDLFQEVLNRPDVYLVTIGYGFADPHINGYIAHAIKDHNLRLCVVSPENPATFQRRLLASSSPDLWDGMYSYWHSVSDLCDPRSNPPPRSTQEFLSSIDLQ